MWYFRILLSCGLFATVCKSQKLSVLGSTCIRPNNIYSIAFTNLFTNDLRLRLDLEGSSEGITVLNATKELKLFSKSPGFSSFQVGAIPQGTYFLSIRSLDAHLIFNEIIDLFYNGKTSSIFIQTDKPIYVPGDVVRFRVIAVGADTRPVTNYNTVDIGFYNTEGKFIRQWKYAKLHKGIFQSTVRLPSSSNFGNWKILVTAGNYKVEKQIEVREYILPNFFVKAYPSEILLIEKKTISVTVESTDISGRHVNGTVRVDLFFHEKMENPDMTITKPISGTATVDFVLNYVLAIEVGQNVFHRDVFVKVKVTETFTNRTENLMEVIPVYKHPYRYSLAKSMSRFKPGLPFQMDLSITDHNGEPAPEESVADILIYYTGESLAREDLMQGIIRKGLATLVLRPPESADRMHVKVKYNTHDYELVDSIDGIQPNSNIKFLRIALKPNQRIRVNTSVFFEISSTEPLSYFSYTVTSRGSVIASGYEPVRNQKRTNFKLVLTSQMAPKAQIIVFYINKVLIYDDIEFNFDTFNNEFSVTLDAMKYHTGQDFHADVKTAKDSYIALWASYQTLALLDRTGHDLTEKDVLNDLALYECTHLSEYDPLNVMGLFMRTTAEFDNAYPGNEMNGVGEHCPLVENIQKPMYTKTKLPKAWFWKNNVMNGKQDKLSFSDSVPDDITSWTVSGFALSPTLGLGIIKQPLTLVVKKPLFYIVLNLPHSIKRYGEATIQVTIYNILENALSTEVTLFNKNNEIEFVGQSSNDTTRQSKTVLVPKSNGHPISFMIKARKLGEIAIKVEAINLLASDTVERMLQVTPESRRYEKYDGRIFDLQQHDQQTFSMGIDIPRDIDEGSVRIKFTLNAKLFDTTISNLESLIHLPTGNGEQNIAKFASNIVILDYLSESGKLSEKNRTKAINYLQSGYQKQLKYKRSDGSFGVQGASDTKGGTFITAFVVMSFNIARTYIDIDWSVVEDAFRWLASIQTQEGTFNEVGRITEANVRGGVGLTKYSLTAYVLIAFLENEDIAAKHRQTLDKSITFLERNFYSIINSYDLALATYVLSLSGRSKREDFLSKLYEESIFDTKLVERYWQVPSVNVEIAGYALLSSVVSNRLHDGLLVLRWLIRSCFVVGRFPGTQDIFVGLKALTKFTAKIHRNNYRVSLKAFSVSHTIDIDKQSMAIQEFNLPNHIRQMDVDISGIGSGYLEVAYDYYQNIQMARQNFQLAVQMLNTMTCHEQHLEICVKYIPKEAYSHSNMAFVEVFFPSGIFVEADGVEDLSNAIQKTELQFAATSVVVYYDNLGPEENCFKVISYCRYKVAVHRPAYVVVYDYYDRDRFAIETYDDKVMQLCDTCEDEECLALYYGGFKQKQEKIDFF
ncbi:thioester-containing protein 1 allele R1-like [Sabethes cyaneus]|uniref:thioester-containing protein 1 allele R1-like n=1 Tax=Sabethes cyaneus TaxID=53552 RepID=UPI00237E8332|nr:thioester-containing protein 1 allele R1-like [Sabethes cyaneus]